MKSGIVCDIYFQSILNMENTGPLEKRAVRHHDPKYNMLLEDTEQPRVFRKYDQGLVRGFPLVGYQVNNK